MKMTKSVLACGAALALTSSVFAQEEAAVAEKSLPAWMDNVYVGVGLGSALTAMDVKQYDYYPVLSNKSEIGFSASGFAGYTLTPVISLTGGLSYATLKGTDRDEGVWFKGNVLETNVSLRLNLTNLMFSSNIAERKFAVYGHGGIGLAMYRAELHSSGFTGSNFDTDPVIGYEGYTNTNLDTKARTKDVVGIAGLGLQYKLTDNIDLFADFSLRTANSDKMDVVVSSSGYDVYNFNQLGAIYRFGDKSWIRPEEDLLAKIGEVDSILDGFKDSDNDGVMDTYDKDNKTPEGAKSYADGTAVDTDGDGVYDYVDQERLSPCTEVDENGVALDTDGDGVANCKDLEPNTEAGAQVDVNGKTIKSGFGAAVAATEDKSDATGGADVGLPSVFFTMNSSTISYTNYTALTRIAQFMKNNPGVKLMVVGHTDNTGPDDYNKKLGEKRAQAVVDHLVKIYGIDASRFVISSKGKEDPLAKGSATNQNRRVDVLLVQ